MKCDLDIFFFFSSLYLVCWDQVNQNSIQEFLWDRVAFTNNWAHEIHHMHVHFLVVSIAKKKMVNTRTDLKSGASGSQSRGVEDGKQTQWGRENRNTSKFFHLHMRAERCSVPHRGHFRLSEHHWLRWITPICSLYSAHAMKGFHLGFARIIVIWPNAGK